MTELNEGRLRVHPHSHKRRTTSQAITHRQRTVDRVPLRHNSLAPTSTISAGTDPDCGWTGNGPRQSPKGPSHLGLVRSACCRIWSAPRVPFSRRPNSWASTLAVERQSTVPPCGACGCADRFRLLAVWEGSGALFLHCHNAEHARVSSSQAWSQTAITKSSSMQARATDITICERSPNEKT